MQEKLFNLRKGSNPSRNSQKRLALGKECCSNPDLKRSYPSVKLPKREAPRIANLYDSSANLFQSESRVESEAELNHYGNVRISHTINRSSSKYFRVEPFHCRLTKTLKEVLLTL